MEACVMAEEAVGVLAEDASAVVRQPVEDPWKYVYKNFYGLAVYYATLFAKSTGRYELCDDIRNELLYGMVEVVVKYADRPRGEVVKIIKTVPRNYWGSKLCVKDMATKYSLDSVVIENVERFEMFYDRYYEKFLDEYFQVGREGSPERQVVMEILYPSKEFQEFLWSRKQCGGVTRTVLRDYFRAKLKWSRGYFDDVFAGLADKINEGL